MAGQWKPVRDASTFRRMAAVAWDPPRDPTIYGAHDIDATDLMAWIDAKRAAGARISPTHAVARAFAITIKRNPGLNCTVRRASLWQREHVNLFLQVSVPPEDLGEDGKKGASQSADLSGVLVRDADTKTTAQIADELREKARKIREGKDEMLEATKKNLSWMPPKIMGWALRLVSWLTHDLGLDLKGLGIANDPFGSMMITSLGMMGVGRAYAPHFPGAKGLGAALVGQVEDGVRVVDGEIRVRKLLPLTVTLDHRVVDGFQASVLAREIRDLLEHPDKLDEPA
jgi:pyruvate/2-oxoglutarate dehydrogenase complex dihydrolipoamide acyltransferase (E2) component